MFDLMQLGELVFHFDRYLGGIVHSSGNLVYAIIFAIVFCEMAALPLFFLPGDPLLFIGGALCASGGLNIGILMTVIFVAALLGSNINFWIGGAIGQKLVAKDYRWLSRSALNRTHMFYETYGGATFLMSPFIAVVRTFAPFIAGVSKMTQSKFQIYNTAGLALWVGILVPAGYFFGNIPFIHFHLNTIILAGIGLGVGTLALGACIKFIRKKLASN